MSSQLEYLCPHCSCINTIEKNLLVDMYQEQSTVCSQCQTTLEVVPANGLDDDINLIVTVADDVPMR